MNDFIHVLDRKVTKERDLSMKKIYLDHAATTYVKPEVLSAMLPYFTEKFGNASASYKIGQENREAINKARTQVATAIGALPEEIYFTSGGSESDNLIIKGYTRANKFKGNHIITTKIEHMAVLNSCKALEKEGFRVTYLDVDKHGMVDIEKLKNSITPSTILISIMFANNEIGTIEPIKQIGEIARSKNIFFHTDAVQAVGNIKIDVKDLNIDALSMSAHKFYGPKGMGAIYIRRKTNFDPIIVGGHQENNKRAGTENVPGIVGLGKAIEIANKNIITYNSKISKLRDEYLKQICEKVDKIRLNGHLENRLPGNANISFEGIDGTTLLLLLSEDGIYASSGSACNSGTNEPSHVLKAIGLTDEMARGALRVTFGEENTESEVSYVTEKIAKHVHELRDY